MKTIQHHSLVLLAAFSAAISSPPAHAVLAPAVGVDSGVARIEHAEFNTGAGGAAAVFDGVNPFFNPVIADGGDMSAPGGFFPEVIGAPNFQNDTGKVNIFANVPLTLTTGPNIPTGFGGATTTLVGVGGAGRAGVAVTNFALADDNLIAGASTNTFAASVVYNNIGGAIIAQFAHFLAATVNLPVGGGYAAAAVRTIFEIGTHNPITGAFAVASFWTPQDILVGFDGFGVGLPDFVDADFVVSGGAGGTLTFSAVSITPPAAILAGQDVRMRGTVSLITDPMATYDIIPLDLTLHNHVLNSTLGTGASSDSASLVPEPGSATLLFLSAGCIAGLRRRRSPR